MRTNVDLTQENIFREKRFKNYFKTTKFLEMQKHERCDECERPICKPWNSSGYCSKCESFFARWGWNRIPCWKQLNYSTYDEHQAKKKIKVKCRVQLGDPNPYVQKQWAYNQLLGVRT